MTTTDPAALSPSPRTTATRGANRLVARRSSLHEFLAEGLVGHLGLALEEHPVVLPVAYAVDLAGPDDGGSLYLHGSAGAGWVRRILAADRAGASTTACLTVTELDGLVLARSAMHHSMNYRCAVVIGSLRVVTDGLERGRALDLIVEHAVPGRAATLRPSTRRELAATTVLAMGLLEASLKVRAGGPVDDDDDVASPGARAVWAGHVPLMRRAGPAVDAEDTDAAPPAHVERRVASLGGPAAGRRLR